MANKIRQDGSGNFAFQDIHDSNFNIFIGKSYQYNEHLDQLKTLERLFALIPETETDERLAVSKKINDLNDFIEQFKKDVLQLAKGFQNIEINTDRLKRAKAFFDKGEFGEARAVLEIEVEHMQDEQASLLRESERYEKDILPKLINNSEEFLILALSMQTDYTNPKRFEDTRSYFERSIQSHVNKFNTVQYADFLYIHNQFNEAEKYYFQCVDEFANQLSQNEKVMVLIGLANSQLNQNNYEEALKEYNEVLQIYRALAEAKSNKYLPEIAGILNNIAILYSRQNNYEDALKKFEESLKIRRALAKDNPDIHLSDVAEALNNSANVHQDQNNYEEALKKYKESLQIRLTLAKSAPNIYLPLVAGTLNNLAVLHLNQNNYDDALKEYEKSLNINRNLAKINPDIFLPDVAISLNNFAALHAYKREFDDALQKFEESVEIYRKLAIANFQTYFPHLARSLSNLGLFYQREIQQKEKSIAYAIETMTILLPYIEEVPFTREDFRRAWVILQKWNLSDEEINRLIKEKIKEMEENQA